MRTCLYARLGIVMILLGGVAVTPSAANSSDVVERAKDEVRSMLPVDSLIQQAAANVSRRYNLNEHQEQLTRDMFEREVNRFLSEHEDDVWPLVRDLARYQQKGKQLDPRTASRLGKTIRPIFEAAREAILDANGEWRNILTDEQKKLHDYDLQEMGKTFKDMDKKYTEWEGGKAEEPSIFPPPKEDNPPVLPKQPLIGEDSTDSLAAQKETYWDTYVKNFIRDYALDKTQITSAQSMLNELKQRAAGLRASRRADFEAVDRRLAKAKREGHREKIRLAQEERTKLNAFVGELFQELKDRLDKIPTPAQRKKFQAKRDRMGKPKESAKEKKAKPGPAAKPKPKGNAKPKPAGSETPKGKPAKSGASNE